jgi:hypothetical protein
MEDGAVWLDGGGRGRNQRCYASANVHFGKSMVEFTPIPTTLSETEQTPLYWAWGYSNLQHGPASHRNSRPRGTYPLQSIYKPRHYINTAPSDRPSRNKSQGSHRLVCRCHTGSFRSIHGCQTVSDSVSKWLGHVVILVV